jgi:hypothetical protein
MKLSLYAPELGEEREQRATIAFDADVMATTFDEQGYFVYSLTNEYVQRKVHKGYTIVKSCWISEPGWYQYPGRSAYWRDVDSCRTKYSLRVNCP